jgi:hypothetical protein
MRVHGRRKWIAAGVLLAAGVLFAVTQIAAQEAAKTTAAAAPAAFTYIGSAKCRMCHMTTKSGAQFKIWQESRHAKAFETLKSPKADEIAKTKGITVPEFVCAYCMD